MSTHDDDHLHAEAFAERRRLVDLLTTATPDDWATDSLCAGWRVREVIAHITMQYRLSMPRFMLGLARHRFRFNQFSEQAALADTRRLDDAALLSCLRENVETRWSPPGGGAVGALSHDVIHGLDVTRPLGWPDAPVDRVVLALEGAESSASYFGTDLDDVTLAATDADLAIGTGSREVRAPAADLLLMVTKRIPMPA